MSEPAVTVEIETGWDPPTSPIRRVLSVVGLLLDGEQVADHAGPVPSVPPGYQAKWRVAVCITATGVKVARSAWRTEFAHAEELQRAWSAQIAPLTADEVLRRAPEWHGRKPLSD